ncbi:MAG TPA: bifunctional DNA-formamidopyrimidine glycosylase/DNA-(apurinic or apyrimidinic site) lyase [Verrucomicrobiae bacterium]|nr:bifunctional DNA-formamidopyrimidine glycosylase/DNA-(apurinic or apyrimidinic site) lyase [Verrucomicrobiae bacterium]
MPELPEVEVLARYLAPLLKSKTIRAVEVRRLRVLRPVSEQKFTRALLGARFVGLVRRGKYLLFTLRRPRERAKVSLLGHLGMTGRMYLQPVSAPLAKHAAVVLSLGKTNFVFEDTRYFGRLTLETRSLETLGPEPLSDDFSADYFARALNRSAQPIKVKLLDQSLVPGVGNIYASEALFRAGISPRLRARKLTRERVERLRQSLRQVLAEAIQFGATIPLDWAGGSGKGRLFYYGQADRAPDFHEERLLVYDRAGSPCSVCDTPIRRIVQAARSTFYCPRCQRA